MQHSLYLTVQEYTVRLKRFAPQNLSPLATDAMYRNDRGNKRELFTIVPKIIHSERICSA